MCWRCSPRHVPTRTESAGPTTTRFIPSKCPPGICWGHPSQQPRTGPPVHLILHLAVVVLTFELSFGFKRALSNVVLVVWGIITTIILFGNMSNCCQTAKLSSRWREQGAHLKSRSYTEVIRVMLVLNRRTKRVNWNSHVHISFLLDFSILLQHISDGASKLYLRGKMWNKEFKISSKNFVLANVRILNILGYVVKRSKVCIQLDKRFF